METTERRDIHRVWDALDALFDDSATKSPSPEPNVDDGLWHALADAIRSVADQDDRSTLYHALDRGLRDFTFTPPR
jgi:hypothetical protein